jgi:hypothetical protein
MKFPDRDRTPNVEYYFLMTGQHVTGHAIETRTRSGTFIAPSTATYEYLSDEAWAVFREMADIPQGVEIVTLFLLVHPNDAPFRSAS